MEDSIEDIKLTTMPLVYLVVNEKLPACILLHKQTYMTLKGLHLCMLCYQCKVFPYTISVAECRQIQEQYPTAKDSWDTKTVLQDKYSMPNFWKESGHETSTAFMIF